MQHEAKDQIDLETRVQENLELKSLRMLTG